MEIAEYRQLALNLLAAAEEGSYAMLEVEIEQTLRDFPIAVTPPAGVNPELAIAIATAAARQTQDMLGAENMRAWIAHLRMEVLLIGELAHLRQETTAQTRQWLAARCDADDEELPPTSPL